MSAPANKPSVLIVDDVPANIRLLADCLREDYGIRVATGGAEALALAGRERPDIILLDVVMPDLDGYQVLERLRQLPETAKTPIVAVTANAMKEAVQKGLAAGFDAYVTKPLEIAPFMETIDTWLHQSRAQNKVDS